MSPRIAIAMAAAFAAVSLLSSCASDIAYIGETYAPTANVEYFFTPQDIKRPYKVMGKAIASPGVFAQGSAELQNDLMICARSHGADAILIENFQKVKTGQTTNWNGNGYAEGRKKEAWWSESGTANTQDQTELQVIALFIKYAQ